jgi:hypothetical protein
MTFSIINTGAFLNTKVSPDSCDTDQAGIEYYMLDYLNNDTVSHIRLPFLQRDLLFDTLRELYVSIEFGANISNIRIVPESFLDEPYVNPKIAQAAIDAGIEDAKHLEATTREVLFGRRYEQIAQSFRNRALS